MVSASDFLWAGSEQLRAAGLVIQMCTDRICPGTFVQSFRWNGLELPGVKTRLGSEGFGCLYWRGK